MLKSSLRRREALKQTRPQAVEYAQMLDALPGDITGIRGRISRITVFPIKSLGGLHVNSARVTTHGLATEGGRYQDRSAMLIVRDSDGNADQPNSFKRFSQREEPALVRARPQLQDGLLSYSVPGQDIERLDVSPDMLVPQSGDAVPVTLYSNKDATRMVSGVLENGPITEWVRAFLSQNRTNQNIDPSHVEVLLPHRGTVRMVDDIHRRELPAETIFSDGGHVLVVSQSTVDWVDKGIKAKRGAGFRTIEADAFRPNIVVEGWPAHLEDVVERIFIEARERIALVAGELCVRCPVTGVDQQTGTRTDGEPNAFLYNNRPGRPGGDPKSITCGLNMALTGQSVGRILQTENELHIFGEKAA